MTRHHFKSGWNLNGAIYSVDWMNTKRVYAKAAIGRKTESLANRPRGELEIEPQSRGAFTLMELLITIAVIFILVALLLPGLSNGKERAYRTQCVSNLKQIALSIQSYADDHNEQLPGPAWLGVYEEYDDKDFTRLPYYLAVYMGIPAPQVQPQQARLAQCPSAAKHWKAAEAGAPLMSSYAPLSYMASDKVTNINSSVVTRPFGYPYSLTPFKGTDEAPKHIREIANASVSWALVDVDQENGFRTGDYYAYLPTTPSHGKVRNQLFFDWHVTARPR